MVLLHDVVVQQVVLEKIANDILVRFLDPLV